MFKQHEQHSLLSVINKPHICGLSTISLIKNGAAKQKKEGKILSQEARYMYETREYPMMYDEDTSDDYDVEKDKQQGDVEASLDSSEQNLSDTTSLEKTKSESEQMQPLTLQMQSESFTGRLDNVVKTLNELEPQPRVTCVLFEDYFDAAAGKPEVMLGLRIRNIQPDDKDFSQQAINAIAEFVDASNEQLKRKEDPIERVLPHAVLTQCMYTHEAHVTTIDHKKEKTRLSIQIDSNGKIKYLSAYHKYDYETDGQPKNSTMSLYRQNYLMDTWSGKIQQIDYQCLYDSLDALFAVLYSQIDVQHILVSKRVTVQMLDSFMHHMHFPQAMYKRLKTQYNDLHPNTTLKVPDMPLANEVSTSSAQDSVVITELTHMSVLMDMHRHMLEEKETFAYKLANALLTDMIFLWQVREELMPRTDEYDAFQYGIVPVAHDTLPKDYNEQKKLLTMPEYMLQYKKVAQTSASYLRAAFTTGTNEMCTWGFAISFLYAAIHTSIKQGAEQLRLLASVRSLCEEVDKRFNHFTKLETFNIYSKMLEPCAKIVSTQAMPLFCVSICSVISLSQAIYNISESHGKLRVLNRKQLVRIDREECDKILMDKYSMPT